MQSVRSEYQTALAQENSLTYALSQQKGEALSMNRKAIDYGVLAREVDSSKQLYDSLMQRAKETGVSGELKTSNIRVVDAAEKPRSAGEPAEAAQPACSGLLGGMLLACGLVFFFEYMDSRIKTPDEIRAHLGLPYLGMLPAIDVKAAGPHPAHQQRRAGELQRGVPRDPDQRAVLVGAGGLASRSWSPARGRARARAWWRATWPSRSRRPASACC